MNRLAEEASPYLRQHADNPVDWYPWGPEASEEAVRSDRPILLSVGYSACHWCHVMAHESFEDPTIAASMNRLFVNVKVDREERPDVDALYMSAVQLMSGQGGWPMTVFLTPDGKPFFAGTYFPPTPRHGMPGFGPLVEAIGQAWSTRRDELLSQATDVTAALQREAGASPAVTGPDRSTVLDATSILLGQHDRVNGGFGRAPKFPQPFNIDLLMRHSLASGDDDSLGAAVRTLDRMAAGGIYDHLGGGFARYSTDDRWLVPHFEKMLYDNALLVDAYLHGWLVTGDADYRQVVTETIEYVLDMLRLAGGAFASAEDADSEGVEGKFYVWTVDEIAAAVGPDLLDETLAWYGATSGGNFEGVNVLHRPAPGALARPPRIEQARALLWEAREQRVRPGLDDKVLTEWNGLMIGALAEAGAVLGRADWIEAAERAATFLVENLTDAAGRWYRNWQERGATRHLAYAEDYVALVDAFTRLGEATGVAAWHQLALRTADALIELFWDDDGGGLFTIGADGEELLIRRKEVYDGATASANGNAAPVLVRLAALHGRPDLVDRANEIVRATGDGPATVPLAHGRLLAGLDLLTGGIIEVVIVGDRPDLIDTFRSRYRPNAVLAWGERFESPLWEGRELDAAFVCRNYVCDLPATSSAELAERFGD